MGEAELVDRQGMGCKDLPLTWKNECPPSSWTLGESASRVLGASGKGRSIMVYTGLSNQDVESHHALAHSTFMDSLAA